MPDNQDHQQNQAPNPFDELGKEVNTDEAKANAAEVLAKQQKLDYLYHKIFKQSAEGQELMVLWTESLINNPGAEPGMCNIEVGIREGYKRFIRNIKLTINRVEKS